MEKNIWYPTDASLLNKAREKLVRIAQKTGVRLRQTYKRLGLSNEKLMVMRTLNSINA